MTVPAKTPANELVVKVDVRRARDPASHVAAVLGRVAPGAATEEVFPGLREGGSAGLVTVRFAGATAAAARRDGARALAADPAIVSVHEPKGRRPR